MRFQQQNTIKELLFLLLFIGTQRWMSCNASLKNNQSLKLFFSFLAGTESNEDGTVYCVDVLYQFRLCGTCSVLQGSGTHTIYRKLLSAFRIIYLIFPVIFSGLSWEQPSPWHSRKSRITRSLRSRRDERSSRREWRVLCPVSFELETVRMEIFGKQRQRTNKGNQTKCFFVNTGEI